MLAKNIIFKYFFVLFLIHSFSVQGQTSLSIQSNFPGGNILVDSIVGNTIYIRPDLRDTIGPWFYWYFEATSLKNGSYRFVFNRPNCLTAMGPAVSADGGNNWWWLFEKSNPVNEFSYFIKANEKIRFSMGMAYTQTNFTNFINPYLSKNGVRLDTLCITPKGRATERLTLKAIGKESPKHKILLTARHHACEMMANYVMEGIIKTLLSDDPRMKEIRNSVEFWFIPFMDKDGVEDGDQGKNRDPRDHNRDYDGKSFYCSTAALREKVPVWSNGKLTMAIDLHCPAIKGDYNEFIYMVGSSIPAMAKEQNIFLQDILNNNKGELKYNKEQGMVSFGTAWNTNANYTAGMSFAKWGALQKGIKLSTTFEIPYAVHNETKMTPAHLQAFGEDIAYSICDYLTGLK